MTAQLLEDLEADDERPWRDFRDGKPITAHGLGRLLRGYHVKPALMRFGAEHSTPARGYRRADFEPVWERYVPTPVQGPQTVAALREEPSEHDSPRSDSPTGNDVTVQTPLTGGQEGDLRAEADGTFAELSATWSNGADGPPLPDWQPGPDDDAEWVA